jgi:hypothetical protein
MLRAHGRHGAGSSDSRPQVLSQSHAIELIGVV